MQILLRNRLHQITADMNIFSPVDNMGLAVRSQHNGWNIHAVQNLGSLDAIQLRHHDVQQRQIRRQLPGQLHRLAPVAALTANHMSCPFEHTPDIQPGQGFVFRHQNRQ